MKVLVVDDDPVGRMLAQTVVESMGHEVLTADDGEQGWQLARAGDVDVVLTDREMPGLDGLELCRRVRAADRGADDASGYCYLVLVTGHASYDQALEGMQAGADDYLGKPLRADELRLRLIAAQRVTDLHRRLQRKQRELAELGDAQHSLARLDPLTRLPNRRALQEELDRRDARAKRYGHTYSLALLDVDHFKSYNDVAGHVAGDATLRAIADVLGRHVRETDGLFRYGGEEFVHLIDTHDRAGAEIAVERLRTAVEALAVPHPARPGQVVTVTAGIARSAPDRMSSQALLGAADSALYAAKQAGRNQTHHADAFTQAVDEAAGAAVPGQRSGRDDTGTVLDPAPLRRMHDLGQQIGRHLAEEIVDTYRGQSADRLAAVCRALDTRDDAALSRAAHTLKGSSVTIGAVALSSVCAELEQAHLWQRRTHLVDELRTLALLTDAALTEQLVALGVPA